MEFEIPIWNKICGIVFLNILRLDLEILSFETKL